MKPAQQRIIELHQEWLQSGGESGRKASLEDADLRLTDLSGLDLRYAVLAGANLERAELHHCNLGGADLRGAQLSYANLAYAQLSQANLAGASAESADFAEASLSGACLDGVRAPYASFRKTDLSYAQGSAANFYRCDFSRANLSHAGFDGARFVSADLTGTGLTASTLRSADLTSARGIWFDNTVLEFNRVVSGAMRPEYALTVTDYARKLRVAAGRDMHALVRILQTVAGIAFILSFTTLVAAVWNVLDTLIDNSYNSPAITNWLAVSAVASLMGIGCRFLRYRLRLAENERLVAAAAEKQADNELDPLPMPYPGEA